MTCSKTAILHQNVAGAQKYFPHFYLPSSHHSDRDVQPVGAGAPLLMTSAHRERSPARLGVDNHKSDRAGSLGNNRLQHISGGGVVERSGEGGKAPKFAFLSMPTDGRAYRPRHITILRYKSRRTLERSLRVVCHVNIVSGNKGSSKSRNDNTGTFTETSHIILPPRLTATNMYTLHQHQRHTRTILISTNGTNM